MRPPTRTARRLAGREGLRVPPTDLPGMRRVATFRPRLGIGCARHGRWPLHRRRAMANGAYAPLNRRRKKSQPNVRSPRPFGRAETHLHRRCIGYMYTLPRKRGWDDEADREPRAQRCPNRRRPSGIVWPVLRSRMMCGPTSGQLLGTARSPKSSGSSSSERSRGTGRNVSGMVGSSRASSLRRSSVLASSRTISQRSSSDWRRFGSQRNDGRASRLVEVGSAGSAATRPRRAPRRARPPGRARPAT
jgi:hypothetical protein